MRGDWGSNPFKLGRRRALKTLLNLFGLTGLSASAVRAQSPVQPSPEPGTPFKHGVASGDPLSDRVILWTRLTPDADSAQTLQCQWEISAAQDFQTIAKRGQASTSAARDFTVKVDATGLKPNTRYFYRFVYKTIVSEMGRTRTLPSGNVDQMTLASCSCADYAQGYFHVYREIAKNSDIDIVIHLGDYIYENDHAISPAQRPTEPLKEALTLAHYRERYALYRTDADLQAAHAAHPFIAIWDDHEIANDSWTGGAANHQATTEGAFAARRDAALKAYEEWMPIRGDVRRPWRSFDFGNMARITVLDTRAWGRDKQLDYGQDIDPRTIAVDLTDVNDPKPLVTPDAKAMAKTRKVERLAVPFDKRKDPPQPVLDIETITSFDPVTAPDYLAYLPDIAGFKEKLSAVTRSLLGDEQEAWLSPQLDGSKKRGQPWQIIAQQVLMAQVPIPENFGALADNQPGAFAQKTREIADLAGTGLPYYLDAWDGYPAARNRVLSAAKEACKNLIVLTGDTHMSWLNTLTLRGLPVGMEIATPSVTSPGPGDYFSAGPEAVARAFTASAPDVTYLDARHRGYVSVTFTAEQAVTRFHYVDTVTSPNYKSKEPVTLSITAADEEKGMGVSAAPA